MNISNMIKERDAIDEAIMNHLEIFTCQKLEDMLEYFWKIKERSVFYSNDRDYMEILNLEIRHLGSVVRKDDIVAIPVLTLTGEALWIALDAAKEVKDE